MQSFKGYAKSINLISEEGCFIELLPYEEHVFKQTLSIHDSGLICFNEYRFCVEPEDNQIMRHRYHIPDAIAQGIIREITTYFKTCDEILYACDAGIWDLKINTIDEKHFLYSGSLLPDNPRLQIISQRIRQVLNNDIIWAFDGAPVQN